MRCIIHTGRRLAAVLLLAGLTAAPSSAAPVMTEDFDDGNWSSFSSDDLHAAYSAQIVSSRSRAGGKSVRFELLKSDPPLNGGTRAELVAADEPPRQERWYGFSIFLPADGDEAYALDRAPEVVAQWHNQPDLHLGESWTSPPLSLLTSNGHWRVHRWWDPDPVSSNDKMWNEGKHEELDLGAYERGVWTDWAFRVRWGWLSSHAPLIEIYKNGALVRTIAGPNTTNDQLGNYFKMGVYKWVWSQNKPSDTQRRVIYHDEVRFADAGGSLQAVSPPHGTASSCPAASAGEWRSVAFEQPQSGVFTAAATVVPGSLAAAATLSLAPSATGAWNALAASVLFSDPVSEPGHPANSILARDGAGYRADRTLVYEAGRRYHVRAVVDVPNRRYSVFVTPEGGQEVALATGYAFRDGHAGTATLSHWVLGAAQGALSACGLQINAGDVQCAATAVGSWRNLPFSSAQSDTFSATIEVTPEQLGAAGGVGLSPATATTWEGMAATLLFSDPQSQPNHPANSLLVRDGDQYRADTTLVYEAGRQYRVRFEVDVPRHRYSVFVRPEGGGETRLATDYRFRQYHESVTALTRWTLTAGRHPVHACAWREAASTTQEPLQCRIATPTQWPNVAFATQTGRFSVFANVVPPQHGAASAIGLSQAPTQQWDGMLATLLFADSSESSLPPDSIVVRDGNRYRADVAMTYQPGLNYAVRMVVDVPRNRYSVYLKPNGGSEVRIADDYAFRAPATSLGQWTVATGVAPFVSACVGAPTAAPPAGEPTRPEYGYLPPAQTVGGGSQTFTVPPGYVHQTAWAQGGGAQIQGVYTHPWNGWTPMVWRWADTMRADAITRVAPAPGSTYPAYRFELTQADRSSPGTVGNRPRAEFFSVDPAEDRRERAPPASNIIRQGDEYWATMAFYLPHGFPTNHKWATLLQRKFQNGLSAPSPWFTLNVHKDKIDATWPRGSNSSYVPVADLSAVAGRWTQITIHEIASANGDGLFELYLGRALVKRTQGPTIDPGDINYNFHLGYYRENESAPGETQGPGTGVVYETPLLIRRGPNPGGIDAVPVLP